MAFCFVFCFSSNPKLLSYIIFIFLVIYLFIYLFILLFVYLSILFIYYLFETGSCYVFLTDLELTTETGWPWTHGDHMTSQALGLQIRGNPTDIHLKNLLINTI